MGNEQGVSSKEASPISNDITAMWKKVNCSGYPAQEGQTACAIGRTVYVFGGVRQAQHEMIESNDLLKFELDSKEWSAFSVHGEKPLPCSAATLTSVGDKLYLFGGLSQQCGWFDNLYSFDTGSLSWTLLECEGKKPSPRDKLQAVAIGTKIYYFGGFGPKSSDQVAEFEDSDDDEYENEITAGQNGADFGWFNDLHIFDTATHVWSQPMQMNLGLPTPRAAFGMCSMAQDIAIFGGRDTEARRNDLHIFSTVSRKWDTDSDPKGKRPSCRSFHTVTSISDNRFIVMGGRGTSNEHFADMHIYDSESKEWYQPNVNGDIPACRGQHCAVAVDDSVLLFGGASSFSTEAMMCTEFLTDTFILKKADITRGGALRTVDASGDAPTMNGSV